MSGSVFSLAAMTWTGDLIFTKEGQIKRIKPSGEVVAAWLQLSELEDKVGWYGFFANELDPSSPWQTEPLYVGLSVRLGVRLKEYETNKVGRQLKEFAEKKPGERFCVIRWSLADAAMTTHVREFYKIEQDLIRILHPVYNLDHKERIGGV